MLQVDSCRTLLQAVLVLTETLRFQITQCFIAGTAFMPRLPIAAGCHSHSDDAFEVEQVYLPSQDFQARKETSQSVIGT